MIQHAFTGAYTNQVSQRNQAINNITQGVKDAATIGLGVAGFAGGLGEGVLATGAEHALAGRVGGVGGNIMLATLQEKKASALANQQTKVMFSDKEVSNMIDVLDNNPINRNAVRELNTVFEILSKSKKGE